MNPLMLIKGELRRSFGGILALSLVLALSLSLGVGVSMTERAVRQGTARAGDAFDLLVGAQGSSVQLMLGAVYLRPQSLPLVPGSAVSEILTQEGVVWAAPLAFGDRWNASPLVGTTTAETPGSGDPFLSKRCPRGSPCPASGSASWTDQTDSMGMRMALSHGVPVSGRRPTAL